MADNKRGGRRPVLRRILIWTGVAVVVIAILAYFGIGFIAAGLATTPTRDFAADLTPAKYGLAYEDVKVTARVDSLQIAGWFIPNQGSDKVVLMVPGRNQSRTSELYGRFVELAASLNRLGLNIMMIDSRGHGQSADAHYSFGLLERRDVGGAVDWLTLRGFKNGSIGALGISMGAAGVVGAASEGPEISAIVEESLFADLAPVLQSQFSKEAGLPGFLLTPSLWMARLRFGFDLSQERPVTEIGAIAPRPILIIHSTDDQTVPETNAEQLRAAYPAAETWIVSGPEHARTYNAYPDEYVQRVGGFFNKYLK
jgi:pimeloyl-ACP methyl ester carboxylesterase